MLYILFILGIIPAYLVCRKVINRRDISFFDIYILGNTLFFLLIPYKGEFIDHIREDGFNLSTSISTLVLVDIFLWMLFLMDLIFRKNNVFSITKNFFKWDHYLRSDIIYVYLSLIASCMMLYKVTDFSELTIDNPEVNNQLYFGSDMPIALRLIWLFALGARPVLTLIVIKVFRQSEYKWHKRISILTLIITLLSYLLGPKTDLIVFSLFIVLYYYSIYKSKISKKQIIKYVFSIILFLCIFFPISQGLRMAKQALVYQGVEIDFISAVDYYVNASSLDKKANEKGTDEYIKGRSLNVFNCLDYTCKRVFRGNGELSAMILFSLLPLNADALGFNSNILGDVYVFKGADIGESILAWFNADFYGVGIVLAAFFYFIAIYSFYKYYSFLSKCMGKPIIMGFYFFYALNLSWGIEINPSGFFHAFYVDYLAAPLVLFVLLKSFKYIIK